MLVWRFIADFVLIVHLVYIGFVVAGFVLTLVGALRRWRWVRSLRFRLLHLAAIGVVVLLVQLGVACPLTTLEANFRASAGQDHYANGGWIEYWFNELVDAQVPSHFFTLTYSLFGLAVAAAIVLIPPRWQAAPSQREEQRRNIRRSIGSRGESR